MDEPRILIKRGLRTAVTGPVTASLMAFPRGAFSSQTIETTDSARVLVLRQSAKQTFLSRFAVGPTSRATFRGLASGPAARIGAVSPGVTHHTAGACRCGLGLRASNWRRHPHLVCTAPAADHLLDRPIRSDRSRDFPAGSVRGKYDERPQAAYGPCDSIESRRYLSRAHNARRIRRESIHLGDLQPRWPARAPQIEEDFPNADRGSLRLDGKRGPAGVERGGRISLS